MKSRLVMFVVIAAAGCAIQQLATESGRPEAFIPGGKTDAVKAVIAETMLARGYQMETETATSSVFIKLSDSVMMDVAFGSNYDRQPYKRVRFSQVQRPDGVRVFMDYEIVTNYGSAFERRTPLNSGKAAQQNQGLLDSIADKCRAAATN